MFEGIRQKVGFIYSKIHFRHQKDKIVSFTDALTKARRTLVIFPETILDNESISMLIRYLTRKFSSEGLTILIREDQIYAMNYAPPAKTITYSTNDINSWFIPRKDLLKRMKGNVYDVALDLNIDLALPSAFICKASKAPIRVSFDKQNGEEFYNFHIKTKKPTNSAYSYRNLLKCLDMF